MRRYLLNVSLLLGAATLTHSALADSLAEYDKLVEERRQLQLEETNARKRFAFVNELEKTMGRFKHIEDERVLGDKGLRVQSAEFSTKLQGWLGKWAILKPEIIKISQSNVSSQYEVIKTHLNELSKDLVPLTTQSMNLFASVREIRGELMDLGEMSDQFYRQPEIAPAAVQIQFSERIDLFNKRIAHMNQFLGTLQSELNENRTHRYAELLALYQSAIDQRLKQLALQNPQLQEAVDAASQGIALVTQYESRLTGLEDQKGKVLLMISKKAYFTSEKLYAEFNTTADDLLKEIEKTKAPDTLKNTYIGRINAAKIQTKEALIPWQATFADPNRALKELLTQRTNVFTAYCKNEKMAVKFDCELARVLIAAQKSNPDYSTWTLAQKLYLEKQIQTVENGPNFRKITATGNTNQ